MLLQIQEPGSPVSDIKNSQIAIGIDLGTTHSLAAVMQDKKPVCITEVLPSVVAYGPTTIVGSKALDAIATPTHTVISSVKRLMGKSLEDLLASKEQKIYAFPFSHEDNLITLGNDAIQVNPIQVSAQILTELKHQSEQYLQQPITQAVITVPAYFDDAARQATKDAARLAGLEVLRLVNEPTAAALAYGLDTGSEGLYGIYDLGGGTFDFSILRLHKGVFQVVATHGDTNLGGDDFDRLLVDLVQEKTGYIFAQSDYQQAYFEAKKCKEALSEQEVSSFNFKEKYRISRTEFEATINPLIQKTLDICQQALLSKDIDLKDLKGIVMVGGSTRVPKVHHAVHDFFGRVPLTNIDPDRAVAYGAAAQAYALTQGSDTLLLDVTPLSLGLETMGGIVECIIERNSAIPLTKGKEFTTYQDGQTGMIFHIVQGERDLAKDCRSLARFELTGIPPMVAGAAKVKVIFQVDSDGLLTVSAKEETTGVHQQVEVKPSYGLNEDQMQQMILQSLENAEGDVKGRLLAESKIAGKRLLGSVIAALTKDSDLLSEQESAGIFAAVDALEASLEGLDRDAIDQAAEQLEKVTQRFAERRITKQMKLALEGQALNTIEQAVTKSVQSSKN